MAPSRLSDSVDDDGSDALFVSDLILNAFSIRLVLAQLHVAFGVFDLGQFLPGVSERQRCRDVVPTLFGDVNLPGNGSEFRLHPEPSR